MLAVLLALQISTTTCHPDYVGGVHCTTMTPPQLQPLTLPPVQTVNTDWGAVFQTMRDNHRAKRIGQYLAAGDCAGAVQYSASTGDITLATQVRDYCAQSNPTGSPAQAAPTVTGPRRVHANTASGYCLDITGDYIGTGAENSPVVTWALPRCDQLTAGK